MLRLASQSVFTILLVNIHNTQGLCPNAWTQNQGSCYYLFQDKEEWPQAMNLCQAHKAHLALVESPEENRFLEHFVKNTQVNVDYVWIGANDMMSEGEWRWTGTDERVTVTDWAHGQPDNWHGDQNCALISPRMGYKWDDASCKSRCHYICETSPSDNIIG